MTLYALSGIKYMDEAGEEKYFEPGDKVEGLPKETMENLVARGNVVKYDPTKPEATAEEELELQEENENLKLQLKQAQEQIEALQQGGKTPSSGTTAPKAPSTSSSSKS